VETAREILFILQRPADLPPSRSISVLAWLKQKQMLSFRVAHMSDRDVLRENHLYGLIAVGMTRKYNPQRWIAVFVRHNHAHPAGIPDGRGSLRAPQRELGLAVSRAGTSGEERRIDLLGKVLGV